MGTSGPLRILMVLAALAVATAVGYFFWNHYRPVAPGAPLSPAADAVPAAAVPGEQLPVTLFIPENDTLHAVATTITRQPDMRLEARGAVNALLGAGPDAPPVLRDLSLRGWYLGAGGTAYVDLAPTGQREIRASAREELLAIYAVVNTLTQNFTEVRQVRILVDGREAQTLAGHIDLSRFLSKRMDLVRP